MKTESNTFDYIVVGAGSAGCVLAARLSEDKNVRVLLVEAGGSRGSVLIDMPTAFSAAMAVRRLDWGYRAEAATGLGGRALACYRGRGLGGSSLINGMVYVRGHARDFDSWDAAGATGWDWRGCLPYFRRAETWEGGADFWRGGSGPLAVGTGNGMRGNPLYRAFIEAGVQAGYAETPDYNGAAQEGFGAMHMTVGGGVRCSARRAYLEGARGRSNLEIRTHALAEHLLFADDTAHEQANARPDSAQARRVIGVAFSDTRRAGVSGNETHVYARREVIIAAGAIGSPALLQRSGVGAGAVLRGAGIPVRLERPGVGANLRDHLEVYVQYRCLEKLGLNPHLTPHGKLAIGLRWILFRNGLGATNHFESCGFIRSAAGVEWPDIQYHFLPAAVRYDGRAAIQGYGFQVHVGPNRPWSSGSVSIVSGAARDAPKLDFRYLSDTRDVEDWRKCLRLTREILAQPALDRWRGEEIQPGADITSDEAVDAWVRANAESAYHPCGTCRMGRTDDDHAVVDSDCRVIGLEGVRVADASIFPTIPNGNLNAPTIMAAERASDLILGLPPLREEGGEEDGEDMGAESGKERGEAAHKSASNSPSVDPDWRTRQRARAPVRAPKPPA